MDNTKTDIILEETVTEAEGFSWSDAAPDMSVQELQNELNELREQLKAERERAERIRRELEGFYECFPDRDIKTLPDEVWETVREGSSLAAAVALYEHRQRQKCEQTQRLNEQNARASTGRVGGKQKEYFTRDEVKSMSRGEVRANYQKIFESMQHWS